MRKVKNSYILNIPGLRNFKSMVGTSKDIETKINTLEKQKKQIRDKLNLKQKEINEAFEELEAEKKKEKLRGIKNGCSY